MNQNLKLWIQTHKQVITVCASLALLTVPGIISFFSIQKADEQLKVHEQTLIQLLQGNLPIMKVGDKDYPFAGQVINEFKRINDRLDKISPAPTPAPADPKFKIQP